MGKRKGAAAAAGRSRSENGEKRQVKKATGKRGAVAAGRSRCEDGEKREVKKAKVGDSSPPTVVCDVITPINSGDTIVSSCDTSPPIFSLDSSLAQLPVIYVQFQHCSRKDAPDRILLPLFSQFGEITDTYPVYVRDDFIFILYKTRDGANKAVQDPLKKLPGGGELLCSITPHALLDSIRQTVLDKVTPFQHHPPNTMVYVCNVNYKADPDELKALFSQFGEITAGPLLFTLDPDWELVHYLIVYKAKEGAGKALKQPDKQLAGHQLHCTGDVEEVVKSVQKEFLEEIETDVGRITYLRCKLDATKAKRQLLQQQDAKPTLSSAINDVLAAAARFKTAADMAVSAAERLNSAVDLITTQLQGSGAGPTSG